ncbi:MAG: hypothetical protein ABI693_33950 [Bryobacteraceae bacterium]
MSNWISTIETTLSQRANARWLTVLFSLSLIIGTTALAQNPLNTYTNFEGSQTTPLRISADGTRLYAVNTAAARLSVFDLTSPGGPTRMAEIPVGIEPVSVNPRTNDEVWVVNQESDSVSVVSVSKGIVTDTIRVSDEPADIVFAGSPTVAFVTNARAGTVSVISLSTHQVTKTISLTGGYPKALAVSPDGSKVYAVFAVSGNQTTLVPPNLAPPQPNPTNPALPPPPQVSKIVSIDNSTYSFFLRFNMPDNDVAIIDANRQRVSGYYAGVGTLNFGIAVRPGVGDLWVTNNDSLNLTDFEPTLKGHFVNNRVTRIQVGSSRIQAFDLNPNLDYNTLPNPQALAKALAQPTAAVFDPGGTFFWVAAFGTDRIAKVDTNGNVLSFVELGASGATADPRNKRGPRGLAVNGPANRLYVQNRISNTISVIDTSRGSLIAELPVGSYDPTPAEIRSGRGFLYDAKLSGNGTNSCASCHFDGDMDHLAWDLGDPGGNMATVVSNGQTFQEHPMKGPMTTQTLKGLAGLAPYHWRGDRASFADFNGAFQSLMGGTPLATSDMSAYTAFINTIAFMPNPFQNLDRTLPTSLNGGNAVNGLNVFNTVFDGNTDSPTCQSCHTANPGPGSNNVVMVLGNAPQPLKVPELRNIYQKLLFNNNPRADSVDGFGLNHDGNTPDMQTFLKEAFPLIARNATNAADLSAYSLCFDTGMAPSVGYARTVTATNLNTPPVAQDLVLLSNQAKAGNIDLIAKGTIQGKVHGLLYDPVSNTFLADQSGLGPFNQSQLGTFVRSGDTLTFMGVPPGSGRWMGIDFNLDGVLDGNQ